uniref:Heavy metal transport/detoxification superfamily protein n=1 Tax=Medicago truncatula TaxID=3880 RepID=B7FGJ5_MEDTR|nr:unknown [Medicago truncatula]AFK43923.1 unknown [Medicago truncatula]
MEQKVAIMRLKVDLQCRKCCKKVKKILCKYPQIRDQIYDEKNGIVTIRVVCCSPEKVRDNICCQGGGTIKSIEIVEPPKPKPAPAQAPAPLPSAAAPAVMFPQTAPMSILAYPSPVVPYGHVYGPGQGGPPQFYGRPVYDSYGWSGPCYVGHHHDCLREEEASTCTIS